MAQKMLEFRVIWPCVARLQQSELLSGSKMSQVRFAKGVRFHQEVMLHAQMSCKNLRLVSTESI